MFFKGRDYVKFVSTVKDAKKRSFKKYSYKQRINK